MRGSILVIVALTACEPGPNSDTLIDNLQIIAAEPQESKPAEPDEYGLRHAIFVSYAGGNLAFGSGLSRRELEWIKATLEVALNAD